MKSQTLSYFGKALSDHAIKQEKLSEFFIFRCIDCLYVRSTLRDQMLGFQSTYIESPPLGSHVMEFKEISSFFLIYSLHIFVSILITQPSIPVLALMTIATIIFRSASLAVLVSSSSSRRSPTVISLAHIYSYTSTSYVHNTFDHTSYVT